MVNFLLSNPQQRFATISKRDSCMLKWLGWWMWTWLSLSAVVLGGDGAISEQPVNFVVVYADDLGYADVGCFGGREIATPHLDQMAKEGMRFTHFYVSQAV
jgi:hypothetical protein